MIQARRFVLLIACLCMGVLMLACGGSDYEPPSPKEVEAQCVAATPKICAATSACYEDTLGSEFTEDLVEVCIEKSLPFCEAQIYTPESCFQMYVSILTCYAAYFESFEDSDERSRVGCCIGSLITGADDLYPSADCEPYWADLSKFCGLYSLEGCEIDYALEQYR